MSQSDKKKARNVLSSPLHLFLRKNEQNLCENYSIILVDPRANGKPLL